MKKIYFALLLLLLSLDIYSQCYSSIAAKGFHNLAIRTDGTLWAWGENNHNQIGNNNNTDQHMPIQIGTDTNWSKVYAGTYFSIALKTDGTLWGWGWNQYGESGAGNPDVPQQIGTDTDWVSAAAGLHFGAAIKADGTLWMWGSNMYGQLGNGTTSEDYNPVPAQVGTATNWVDVSLGSQNTLALKSDGTMWSWGNNSAGSLGQGIWGDNPTPTQIGTSNQWVKIYQGYSAALALKSDGTLWAWGYNEYGMVGDGTSTNRSSPVQVGTSNDWQDFVITTHVLAIKTNGTLWAWGRNSYGRLGTGTITYGQYTPIQIGSATDWVEVMPGFEHSLALRGNGTLWAWGHNNVGQLGDGTTVDKLLPTQIGAVCGVVPCTVTIGTLADITAQCAVAWEDITPPALTDNCGNTITPTTSTAFPITGTSQILWTYATTGGPVNAVQNVIIDDTTAPVPTLATLPVVTGQCEVTLTPPVATDNCAGNITATTTTAFPVTMQGDTTVTWTYNDGNGNTFTQNQLVTIDDTDAPVPILASLPDVTGQCSATITPPIAADNCAGTISAATSTSLPITQQGTTVVTWYFNDGNGNVSSQIQTFIVGDTSAPVPVLSTLPDVLSVCYVSVAPPVASDTCGGAITATTTTAFPITEQGLTVITWTYNDGNGNITTQTQNVIVADNEAPVLVLNDVTLNLDENGNVTLTGEQIDNGTFDNCGLESVSVWPSVFDCDDIGDQTVTVSATDVNGNIATSPAIVTITDPGNYCATGGLSQLSSGTFTVHPNPASDTVYIDTMGKDILAIQLYSALGQQLGVRYSHAAGLYSIDVAGLEAGVYFMSFTTADGYFKGQFIKK